MLNPSKKSMHEAVLRDYFLGKVNARELAKDVTGTTETSGVRPVTAHHNITDMSGEFEITRLMIVKLLDDVLHRDLNPVMLGDIGFCILASDHFVLNSDADEVLVEVINDMAAPWVNYELNLLNVERFRRWLNGDEPYPERPQGLKPAKNV